VPTLVNSAAVDSATELYLGFFGRAPDTAGLAYWASQIASGQTPVSVAAGFAQSAEFHAQYDNLSASAQVNQIYQDILGRAPDAAGAQYWTTQLQTGTAIGQVVWDVVNAAFNEIGTADGVLVQSEVHAGELLASAVVSNTSATPWSAVSGFGEINVASALSAALNTSLAQGSIVKTGLGAWQIGAAHFQDAQAAGYTGKGVVIAEIDTGIDLNNSALTKNLSSASWNFVANNANVQDDNGHGTAVASEMIAQSANSSGAFIGGAPDAQLMVLKALDANGNGTDANLVAAINYAVSNGANVINISSGGGAPDANELAALTNAQAHGVIVVMAAGNAGASSAQYPAQYAQSISTAIAVGSSAQNFSGTTLAFASNSNQAGTQTAYNYIDAPGVSVLAYGLNNVLQTYTGTSFAAPLVTAEVADVLSAHAGLSATQVVQAVVNTAIGLVGLQTAVV
jgi:subtilisin family serine protease